MSVSVGKSSIVSSNLVLYLDPSSPVNYSLTEVEVLAVAGGGAGGGRHAGGGGGGGVIYVSSHAVTQGSAITVTVGNGGATGGYGSRGGNGQNSVFGSLIAIGGGGGGGYADGAATVIGASGGSGGGGAGAAGLPGGNGSGGAGTPGQGNRGGDPWASGWPGGGGGGAGQRGSSPRNGLYGGRGGDGLLYNISGTPRYYGGGGGGAGESNVDLNGGLGGLGGGGRATGAYNPTQGQPGQANTGGGGGGSRDQAGALGGSGVVIVRYPGPQKATGGNTITQVGGYTIHTFNSSGTFTPLTAPVNTGSVYGLQDLSANNITLTQSGGVTYSTENGGSFVFDGVNDLLITTPTPLLLQGNPNITVIGFYRRTGNFAGRGFWGIGGSNVGGTGQGINNWNNANTNEIAIDSWGQSTFTTGQTYPLNTWIGVAWRKIAGPMTRANCIISIFNGTTLTHYTSTSLSVLRGEAGSNLVINSIGGLTIGSISIDTGYCSPVNIGSHCIYDRVLTDAEIQQNFNALRGRFGI